MWISKGDSVNWNNLGYVRVMIHQKKTKQKVRLGFFSASVPLKVWGLK